MKQIGVNKLLQWTIIECTCMIKWNIVLSYRTDGKLVSKKKYFSLLHDKIGLFLLKYVCVPHYIMIQLPISNVYNDSHKFCRLNTWWTMGKNAENQHRYCYIFADSKIFKILCDKIRK